MGNVEDYIEAFESLLYFQMRKLPEDKYFGYFLGGL